MSVSVETTFYVCSRCSALYGYAEQYGGAGECPFCIKRERNRLKELLDEKNKLIELFARRNSSLKGVITKLKGGRHAVRKKRLDEQTQGS